MSANPRPAIPRLYATPLAAPFLPALVKGVLDGVFWPGLDMSDPLALARVTVYVPGRRLAREVARALERAVAERGRAATLLPNIVAFADIDDAAPDEDDSGVRSLAESEGGVGGLAKHLAVMKLVDDWPRTTTPARADGAGVLIPCSPADTAHLAADLIRLMDEMARENADWAGLDALVEDRLTAYWGVARDFLRIAHEDWPSRLAAAGVRDDAEERRRAVAAEAERLARGAGPVLAVASPAYTRAAGELLAAVGRREGGAVLVPGLDAAMEEGCWEALRGRGPREGDGPDEGHGQCGLSHLLERLRVPRADLVWLAGATPRDRVLAEALRPAETCDRWASLHERLTPDLLDSALDGVTLMEADTPREESVAVALSLRQALHEGHERIALVTPDRTLARRVTAELERWEIEADDSGGRPLGSTPPAVLARLALTCVKGGVTPVDLLALLKHPLARPAAPDGEAGGSAAGVEAGGNGAGVGSDTYRRDLRRLDRALRGLKPRAGFAGLHAHVDANERKSEDGEPDVRAASARAVLTQAEVALGPLLALHEDDAERPVHEIADAHRRACLALAGPRLFAQEDGEGLARILDALAEPDRTGDPYCLPPGDYAALFTALLSNQAVRNRRPRHASIQVLGLLEARQLAFDHVVLAGLNEGSWPDVARNDAWLSRPMRRALGLPPPERRLGEAAHDFAQGFATPSLVLSRSLRSGDAPTLPARWLQRLGAVAGEALDGPRGRGRSLLAHARALDAAPAQPPLRRPNPAPPVEARPVKLSVTEIETLIRDPYSIYARHVLRLRRLDDLCEEPGPREFGIAVHAGMEMLAKDALDEDTSTRVRDAIWRELGPKVEGTESAPVWERHIARLAAFAAEWERARRETGAAVHAERHGTWTLDLDGTPFVLSGRADRIERGAEGGLTVIDHKTGQLPSRKQVAQGFQPQLGLLAAMAAAGAFDDGLATPMTGGAVHDLGYTRLQGRGQDGDEMQAEGRDPFDPQEHVAAVSAGLHALLLAYRDAAQGYPSAPRVQFRDAPSDYGHLARLREWALVEDVS